MERLYVQYSFDADDFTIKVAKDRLGLNEILDWLIKNTNRTWLNVIRQWFCKLGASKDGTISTSKVFSDDALILFFMPRDGFNFFRYKIIQEQHNKWLKSNDFTATP
jgi:hypothetical protein